ncbi:MAG: hypothetical protein ACJ75S_06995 [Solirubrobacterales bacterium]|jgi:hypothetical protein
MGMICEIHCDVRIDGSWPDDVTNGICDTHNGRSPTSNTPRSARADAKRIGWIRVDGKDICPGCQKAQREGTVPFIFGRSQEKHDGR